MPLARANRPLTCHYPAAPIPPRLPRVHPGKFPVAQPKVARYRASLTWNSTQIVCCLTEHPAAPAVLARTSFLLSSPPPAADAPKGPLPPRQPGFAPLCTTLHYFALLCSDFEAWPHLKPPQLSTSLTCQAQMSVPKPREFILGHRKSSEVIRSNLEVVDPSALGRLKRSLTSCNIVAGQRRWKSLPRGTAHSPGRKPAFSVKKW